MLFIQSFKKVADTILKCDKIEEFSSCMKKFSEFIKNNIKSYETYGEGNGDFEFELKFELGQINSLKQKNNDLEAKIWKLKEDL